MREDLINSAITFLQDPSVAASPVEKRVAFLQSKNLTQEEVDAALRRVGEIPPPSSTAVTRPSSPSYSFAPQYYAPMPQQAPPVPARDWRDWFVMATVTGGVGYGLFYLTKRYVYPLIAPPTPPQLESDKADVDRKFAEAFDILDTLKTDTAALKAAEEDRKAKVDAALEEVESVVQDLKNAAKRREDESKRVGDEVRSLRDLIPKALEGQKENQKKQLEDLQTELQSLKSLVINRTAAARPSTYVTNGVSGTPPLDPGSQSTQQTLGTGGNALGGLGRKEIGGGPPTGGLPFGGTAVGGKPAIPAWQMAAAAARTNSAPPVAAQTPPPAPKVEDATA